MVVDKMVRTKWYTDKMALDKMVWTKWHEQNGTEKILRIKPSINPAPIDNMIFSSIPLPLWRFLAFLYVLIIYLWLLVTKCILNSTELICTQNIKLYPFVQYHFVYTILSNTILSVYHFVRTILSATILFSHPSKEVILTFHWMKKSSQRPDG